MVVGLFCISMLFCHAEDVFKFNVISEIYWQEVNIAFEVRSDSLFLTDSLGTVGYKCVDVSDIGTEYSMEYFNENECGFGKKYIAECKDGIYKITIAYLSRFRQCYEYDNKKMRISKLVVNKNNDMTWSEPICYYESERAW